MFEIRKNLDLRKIFVTPKIFLKSGFHCTHWLRHLLRLVAFIKIHADCAETADYAGIGQWAKLDLQSIQHRDYFGHLSIFLIFEIVNDLIWSLHVFWSYFGHILIMIWSFHWFLFYKVYQLLLPRELRINPILILCLEETGVQYCILDTP